MAKFATRSFLAHLKGASRRFQEGEEVPEEWAATVGAKSLLSDSEPASVESADESFPEGGSVDTINEWVLAVEDGDRVERARVAYDAEREGKQRTTLLAPLAEILGID